MNYHDKLTRRDRLHANSRRTKGFIVKGDFRGRRDDWLCEHGESHLKGQVVWFTVGGVVNQGIIDKRSWRYSALCAANVICVLGFIKRTGSGNFGLQKPRLECLNIEAGRLYLNKEDCLENAAKHALCT